MKIVQVCPQSDWVLSIVAEDGRMGKFDVRPDRQTRRLKTCAVPANSRKSSMVATLSNGIVAPICQQIQLRHAGRLLTQPPRKH